MNISLIDIFKYIFKWKFLIIVIVILSLGLAYVYVDRNQSYSAQVIIKYESENAKKGLTPSGEKLDVYEMTSPNIISAAIKDLNINSSIEAIRAGISISPIIPQEQQKIIDAKIKNGEEYSYIPINYMVTYTVGSSSNGTFARNVLDAILKNYNIYFSEKYLNQTTLSEIDKDLQIGKYDYIEIADIMKKHVDYNMTYLSEKADLNKKFRSSKTGLDFEDLLNTYRTISNFRIPQLYADIFTTKITLNSETLIKKYTYKRDQLVLQNKGKIDDSNLALNLMNEFVKSNINVPNAYTPDNSDEQKITEVVVSDKSKTTYDDLIDKYVDSGVTAGNLQIDANYCDNVINLFKTPVDSSKNLNIEKTKIKVNNDINLLKSELQKLYELTNDTINDYNKNNASQYILYLSGIALIVNMSLNFYLFIAFAVGTSFGMVLAVAIEIIKNLNKNFSKE